jgi:putative ABC transport system permease protein
LGWSNSKNRKEREGELMRPLSPVKYVKSNMKKVAISAIGVMIGVFVVYFYSLITETTNYAMQIAGVNQVKEFSIIYPGNNKELPQTLIEEFKNKESVKDILPIKTGAGSLRYHLGLSSMQVDVYNLYSEDIPKFLDRLDLKLKAGELPKEGTKDILIPERFAKQNNLKVNSIIDKNLITAKLDGDYRVCGIFDGPSIIGVVNEESLGIDRIEAFKYGFLYSSKDGSHKDLSYLKDRQDIKVQVYDYKQARKFMKDMGAVMNLFSYGLGAFMIVILCITLGNLNYITFSNRIQEFFILHSMGYKNSTLMRKLWKENLLVCSAGYIFGLLLAITVVTILNITVFSPNGKPFLILSYSGLICSAAIPAFVSFFSLIPCLTSKYYDKINVGV